MTTTNEYIQGLRDMADYFEAHPQFANPYATFTCNIFADDMAKFTALCRQLGGGDKTAEGGFLELSRSFGPHAIAVNIAKAASCEKVQVGTKTRKVIIPAEADTISDCGGERYFEVTEPEYEWVCLPVWTKAGAS
jgi:hypothetical protein